LNSKFFGFFFRLCTVFAILLTMSGCDLSGLLPKIKGVTGGGYGVDTGDGNNGTSGGENNGGPREGNNESPSEAGPPSIPTPPPPTNPPIVTQNHTWYVSSGGNDSNAGTDGTRPLATVQAALTRIKREYTKGRWPSGTSAVIVIGGKIVATSYSSANDAMVDVSGAGSYPPIILEGDPVTGGILDADKNREGRVLYIGNNTVTLGKRLVLTGGRKLWGGAVCVGKPGSPSEGELIIDGGEISGNNAGSGGAVMIFKGSVRMISGVVKNNGNHFNNNDADGAGIYVNEYTTLYLSGGTIEANGSATKTLKGGGLYINGKGFVMMTGGKILNNASIQEGGGVYIAPMGVMHMSDGTISGNMSAKDGGVHVGGFGAVFQKTGGSVTGNTPE
jgi:hypothetical protein